MNLNEYMDLKEYRFIFCLFIFDFFVHSLFSIYLANYLLTCIFIFCTSLFILFLLSYIHVCFFFVTM